MTERKLIGWPEAIVAKMWPCETGDSLIAKLAEQREYYRTRHAPTDLSLILGGMVQRWEYVEGYDQDPETVHGQAMGSIDAALAIYQEHRNGEAFAEGVPSGGGIPKAIPPIAWRGAHIVPEGDGFALLQDSTGNVLFHDVWLGAPAPETEPTAKAPRARKPGGGRKPEKERWIEYAAALAAIIDEGGLDAHGDAAPIHARVSQYLLDRDRDPFEIDNGRDIITLAQAWARGDKVSR